MRAKLLAIVAGCAMAAPSLRAQSGLQFVVSPASLSGTGSNYLTFSGSLVNTGSSSNLYLNGIVFDFFGDATNYLGGGSNAFFANVPGILLPGEAYNDVVFQINISSGTPPGDYFASVTIQGGSDIFAVSNLASSTILITSTDSVGDGIPDWWRQQYFGGSGTTTNAGSCATCDADGTGQDNLFKYVAGLVPTNPASVFAVGISNTASVLFQPALIFGPAVAGRSYTWQSSASLSSPVWSPVGASIGPGTNSSRIVVTDGTVVQSQKFYRVGIALP